MAVIALPSQPVPFIRGGLFPVWLPKSEHRKTNTLPKSATEDFGSWQPDVRPCPPSMRGQAAHTPPNKPPSHKDIIQKRLDNSPFSIIDDLAVRLSLSSDSLPEAVVSVVSKRSCPMRQKIVCMRAHMGHSPDRPPKRVQTPVLFSGCEPPHEL